MSSCKREPRIASEAEELAAFCSKDLRECKHAMAWSIDALYRSIVFSIKG